MQAKKEYSLNSNTELLPYHFTMSDITWKKCQAYARDLQQNKTTCGKRFRKELEKIDESERFTNLKYFIAALIRSKKDNICAEATEFDPKKNWNATELSILGDISCVMDVQVYDDGTWSKPTIHKNSFPATLVFVPGALLETAFSEKIKPDYDEICPAKIFNKDAYYKLYERRLLAGLLDINEKAKKANQKLFITIPGIGCGQFAGELYQQTYDYFPQVLQKILELHGDKFTEIEGLWFDNFKGKPSTKRINNIDFFIRPQMNGGKPQLCHPEEYDTKYKNCHLVSFVAWDPVSLPTNDFFIGNRTTDDGVKGAATSAMHSLLGVEGVYNEEKNKFLPKDYPDSTWQKVRKDLKLDIQIDLQIYSPNGNIKIEDKDIKATDNLVQNSIFDSKNTKRKSSVKSKKK